MTGSRTSRGLLGAATIVVLIGAPASVHASGKSSASSPEANLQPITPSQNDPPVQYQALEPTKPATDDFADTDPGVALRLRTSQGIQAASSGVDAAERLNINYQRLKSDRNTTEGQKRQAYGEYVVAGLGAWEKAEKIYSDLLEDWRTSDQDGTAPSSSGTLAQQLVADSTKLLGKIDKEDSLAAATCAVDPSGPYCTSKNPDVAAMEKQVADTIARVKQSVGVTAGGGESDNMMTLLDLYRTQARLSVFEFRHEAMLIAVEATKPPKVTPPNAHLNSLARDTSSAPTRSDDPYRDPEAAN